MNEPREPLTPEHVHKVLRWVNGVPPVTGTRPGDVDVFKDAERLALEWLAQREQIAKDAERIAVRDEHIDALKRAR